MSDEQGTMTKPVVSGSTNTTPDSVKTGATDRVGQPWGILEKLLPFLGIWENGVADGKNFAHQTVTRGFILKVYKDSRGLPTVGAGHLVVTSDKLKVGDTIKEGRAKELLAADIAEAENAVNRKIKIPLYQYEYDALVSLTFNSGTHGAAKLFDVVNKGNYNSIPAIIEKYRIGGGNEGRRASEANLFKSGVYDATH